MSMCKVISCVVGTGCLLWPVCSLDKTPLAFAALHFVLQEQTCLLLQVSPDFLLLHSNPLWWKGHLFLVLVLEELVDLPTEPVNFSFFSISGGAQTWITVMLNSLPSKQTEIILSFLRLQASIGFWILVDYKVYSVSSEGFLPMVVFTTQLSLEMSIKITDFRVIDP